jgi:hypothetical protein
MSDREQAVHKEEVQCLNHYKRKTQIFIILSIFLLLLLYSALIKKNPYSVFILKISNLTGYRIHFKIRCNNSKCYTVTPYE